MRRLRLVVLLAVGVVVGALASLLWLRRELSRTMMRPALWQRFDLMGTSWAEVLGALGFVVALVLGIVKLWETFGQKPKLTLDFEWEYRPQIDPDNPHELRIYVSNGGRRKDTVREIGFAAEKKGYPRLRADSIRDQLPLVIEPNVVKRFGLGVHPNHAQPTHREFHQKFVSGEIASAYLIDGSRKDHWFSLPKLGLPVNVELSS